MPTLPDLTAWTRSLGLRMARESSNLADESKPAVDAAQRMRPRNSDPRSMRRAAPEITELVRTDVDRRDDRLPGRLPRPIAACRHDRGLVATPVAEHAVVETKRLEVARAAMANWKAYRAACRARHKRAPPAPEPPPNRTLEQRDCAAVQSPSHGKREIGRHGPVTGSRERAHPHGHAGKGLNIS